MKPDVILDTNVLILFFSGRLTDSLPYNDNMGYSVITELELLSYPQLSVEDEHNIKRFLDKILSIPLTEDIKKHTITLRKRYKIKLPDAIICATAMVNDATLLTNDKQLLTIPDFRSKSIGFV